MILQKNDGGRAAAGYSGTTGDCVTRAIAIATGKPYQEIYDALNDLAKNERRGRRRGGARGKGISSARGGVYRQTYDRYLKSMGRVFTPTMEIGTRCVYGYYAKAEK